VKEVTVRPRRRLVLLSVMAVLVVLAAVWTSTPTSGGQPPSGSPATAGARAGGQAARLAQRPGRPPAHLIVVVEENHSFEQIIGSPAAPFLNHLATHGTLLTRYYAITHPSLPNYVALQPGRWQG
jgi:hypothetical protein